MQDQCSTDIARRRCLQAIGALSLFGLVGCRASETPLKIAAQVWLGYEFMFLARQRGWLDETQIRLIEVIDASDSSRLLADGLIDGAALTLDEVLRLRASGVDLTVVAIFDFSAGADAVVARPTIRSLTDLKGKRIGVEDTAVGGLMLLELLQRANLKVSEVQVIHTTVTEQEAKWLRGEIDALVTYAPVLDKLEREGAKRIFDSRDIPNKVVDVLAVRSQVLRYRSASLRHLLQAHFRALAEFNATPQRSADVLSARLHVPATDVAALYGGVKLTDVSDNQRLLSPNDPTLRQTAAELNAFMLQKKWISQTPSIDILFSDSLISTLQETGK